MGKTYPNHNLPSDWLSYAGWLDQRNRPDCSTSAHISSLGHVSQQPPPTKTEPRINLQSLLNSCDFTQNQAHIFIDLLPGRSVGVAKDWCVCGGRLRRSGASSLMLIKGTGGNLQDAYAINMKQQVNDTGGKTFWLSFWVHPLYLNAMSICTSCVDFKELGHIWGDSQGAAQEIGWWDLKDTLPVFLSYQSVIPAIRSYKLGHSTLKYSDFTTKNNSNK